MTTPNPQLAWTQLLRTALLGTRQSPEPLPDLLGLPDDAAADQREKHALLTAGTLALIRKAGFQLPPALAADAAPAPAPAETQPALGANGAAQLQILLSGQHPELLPDYLRDLAAHGRRVPHPLLVPLLDHARTRPELHRLTGPVLGQRGAWLAAQNPEWQTQLAAAPEAPDDTLWETGTLRQRVLYLEALRQREPRPARELLAAALPAEPAKNQAQLLETLAINLESDDAALLEQYLASKSKEVRQTVLPLLVQLPGSAVLARLWQRAEPLLTLKSPLLGSKKLLVTLPGDWDKTWLTDGIEQKDGRFQGEKAALLGQLLALIPPQRWAAHWQLPPAKILTLAAESEWAGLLLVVWHDALLLHPSPDWALAYLQFQLENDSTRMLTGTEAANLLGVPEVATILLRHLPRNPRLIQPPARWEHLLLDLPGPWPVALTTAALSIVENTAAAAGNSQFYMLHHRLNQLLQHLRTVVPPAQYALVTTALTALHEQHPDLSTQSTQLLNTLIFRQQLTESLTEKEAED